MQRFIEAVLLIPVFERTLSFRMLCFVNNDRKIIPNEGGGLSGSMVEP